MIEYSEIEICYAINKTIFFFTENHFFPKSWANVLYFYIMFSWVQTCVLRTPSFMITASLLLFVSDDNNRQFINFESFLHEMQYFQFFLSHKLSDSEYPTLTLFVKIFVKSLISNNLMHLRSTQISSFHKIFYKCEAIRFYHRRKVGCGWGILSYDTRINWEKTLSKSVRQCV